MSRPPRARESVLDAFEQLLVDDGERAATMDATARAAGVSKGGLLYHFASKDALEHALLERLVLSSTPCSRGWSPWSTPISPRWRVHPRDRSHSFCAPR